MTQLVVILIKSNGFAHLGSGNLGVNETLGHCCGREDDVSINGTGNNVIVVGGLKFKVCRQCSVM